MPQIIVLSTCGSMSEARKIARNLVRRRLAACVNILAVNSCYRWKGRIVSEREWLMIIKSNSIAFQTLKQRIIDMHSYELPEVISLKVDRGSKPYLAWLDGQVG